HRLDVACRLASALIETGSPESLALVEELELPTAAFEVGARTPHLVNAAWRALFGARDTTVVSDAVGTGGSVHIAELTVDAAGSPCFIAVTIRRCVDEQVIVACIDITDEVLARQLAVGASALVWSGPRDGTADYFNHAWSAYGASQPDWQKAIEPEDLAKCTKGLACAIRSRGSTDVEARICSADGVYRWHHVRFGG